MRTTLAFITRNPHSAGMLRCKMRIIAICLAGVAISASPASAFTAANSTLQHQLKQDSSIVQVVVVRRGAAVRRTTVVGPAR